MYFPKDIKSLIEVYKYITFNHIDYYIIGNGTNLLINERYFETVFINLKQINAFYQISERLFFLTSGASAIKIALDISKKGYTGLEFLSVIPGTIGGLIYMNASAYEKDMSNIVESVLYLSEDGDLNIILNQDIDFKYRYSKFQNQKGIILGCIVKVEKANYNKTPISKIKSYMENKKNTQPIGKKNAGSTFKNMNTLSAWKIIDDLGYRGKIVGGAMVSKKHANFIINYNNASFSDVKMLIDEIKEKSLKEYKIKLECEWQILE